MKKEQRSASDVLEGVVRDNLADYISLREIKISLHERGFGLLMIIFALPLSIPLPLPPGATFIPALPLVWFSIQMLQGVDSPWLPNWIAKKKIKRETVALIIEKGAPYLKKIEKLLRARFPFASSRKGERLVGLFCLIFSISILIPLPFTNLIPAVGIVLMSLGLLSKDGIVIALGMILGSIGIAITGLIILLGKEAVMGVMGMASGG